MISMTIFATVFDNKTDTVVGFPDFEAFTKSLEYLSTQKGYKPKKGERVKKSSPLISPALYKLNTTRANANVVEWGGFAMLDVDTHDFSGDLEYDLATTYPNIHYVCYSTASSTKDHPKFRLVFPLSRRIQGSEVPHFWYALNTHFGQVGDAQTRDCSRMFYIPGQYPGANNFFFTHTGNELDVDNLLNDYPWEQPETKTFLDRLHPDLRAQVIAHRERKLEDGKKQVTWSSYSDCPFVSQSMVGEYKSMAHHDGTGRYQFMYKMMTSIARRAIKSGYPISEYELTELIRQLDRDTANLYAKRPLTTEARRAISWAISVV